MSWQCPMQMKSLEFKLFFRKSVSALEPLAELHILLQIKCSATYLILLEMNAINLYD
jgi:hypothetical protein